VSTTTTGAEARHRIANLLHTYTEIADRKDVPAGVDLLGDATVAFPAGGFSDRDGAEGFLGALWGSDVPHRHDVTNLVVEPEDGELWRAHAHYSRWVFTPDPVLHTLGNYDLLVDGSTWRVLELTVRRSWTTG
jgi:hypothetical protein